MKISNSEIRVKIDSADRISNNKVADFEYVFYSGLVELDLNINSKLYHVSLTPGSRCYYQDISFPTNELDYAEGFGGCHGFIIELDAIGEDAVNNLSEDEIEEFNELAGQVLSKNDYISIYTHLCDLRGCDAQGAYEDEIERVGERHLDEFDSEKAKIDELNRLHYELERKEA